MRQDEVYQNEENKDEDIGYVFRLLFPVDQVNGFNEHQPSQEEKYIKGNEVYVVGLTFVSRFGK